MATLYQLEHSTVVRTFPLRPGVTTMGRGGQNDIVVHDAAASRVHCRLVTTRGQTVIEDLHSHNGTWLSDARLVVACRLENGSRFRIGRTIFVLRADANQATVVSTPPSTVPSPSEAEQRLQDFRFKIRWRFDWCGFAFGWRIRRTCGKLPKPS